MPLHRLNLAVASFVLLALSACSEKSETELLASAKAMLDKQDAAGAIIEIKNTVAAHPESAAARFLLGKTLLAEGDPSSALVELLKAQEGQTPENQVVPEIARAMLATGASTRLIAQFGSVALGDAGAAADLKTSLATARSMQGQIEAARADAALALQAKPGYAPAMVLLSRLDAAAGQTAEALSRLDEVLAREAGNAEAGLLKGEMLSSTSTDANAAVDALRKVRAAHPKSVAAHAAVINTLIQKNRRQEARSDFPQLQQFAPNHPDTLFLKAQFAFDDKDYKTAREITQKLLAATPDNVLLLSLAGAAEFQMQGYTVAEGLLARALKNAPQMLATRHLLAQTYLRNSQPARAVEVLQPVTDSADADAASLGLAGEAMLLSGDGKRSDALFGRALKAAPGSAQVRTAVAMSQSLRGDNAAALAQLEAIAKADSGAQADMALVSARLQRNDLKGALQAVDTVVRKLPERAFPLALRGHLLGTQGDMAGAAASFEQALAKEPQFFAAIEGLAAIELGAGKGEQARQRFQNLIKADPRHLRARQALADVDMQLGAPNAAVVAQLREAVKIDPAQARLHLALVERLMFFGDSKAALSAAQDAAAALPNDLAVSEALGLAQIASGDSQQAVSTFSKLAALQPTKARYQLQLADAHNANKDRAAANRALRQALALEPENQMALRGLALLTVFDGRASEGVAMARAIQKRKPKDMLGYALEGEIEETARNWPAAASAYSAALQRGKSSDIAVRLHRNLVASGKDAEAERLAAEWLRANSKDVAFIRYLGDRALAAKDWPVAEARYRAVVALQPRHAVAMNNVAWLLATQKKPGAVDMAERANALMPDRAGLLDTLAFAQEAEDQLPKAVETQKRAVSLDPKDPMLRLHLAKLLVRQGNKSDARTQLETLTRLGDSFASQAEVAAMLKTL